MTASLLPAPTSSPIGVRVGSQTPRVRNAPPYVSTLGGEAAELMAQVGKPLLPHQREWCEDSMGRRADGKWSSYESGIFEARQNGKGVNIEARELYSLFILQTRRIIHSAHLFDTSREAFERLMEIIDGSDWLTKRVAQVNRAHGKEGITLIPRYGGGSLKYKARTVHGARGFSGELIVLDEAYALTSAHMAAISPILATLPNPAILYASSPPDDKTGPMPEDAFLPSVRKRGLAVDPRMTYWEFSPPEKYDPSDVDVWYQCNPSLGYLIQEEFLADQFRIFLGAGKVQNFSTEHLGVWPEEAARQWAVISEDAWTNAGDAGSKMTVTTPAPTEGNPVVFAAWISPDREHGAIAVVGPREDGDLHGEVIEHKNKTTWMLDRAVKLVKKWRPRRFVVDAGGATGSLVADLQAALVPEYLEEITLLSSRDVAKGYGSFVDAVDPQAQDEDEEPVKRLRVREKAPFPATTAVAGATTRRIGDGTTWDSRENTVDISPLRALTDALQGYLTLPKAEPYYPPAAAPQQATPAGDFWRSSQRLNL